MPALRDGTVLPSYLGVGQPTSYGSSFVVNQSKLRVGRICAIYSATNPNSKSKKFIEYDVEVEYSDGGSQTKLIYPRCIVSSIFGGIGDYFEWTPRFQNTAANEISQGSYVLIACVNGNGGDALIIGGVPHPKRKSALSFQDGHQLVFEFNGIKLDINDDGDLTILHKGKTDAAGNILDKTGSNSQIVFDSQGNIRIGYVDEPLSLPPNIWPSITWDKGNKRLLMQAENGFKCNTDKDYEINTKFGVKINPSGLLPQQFVRGTIYRSQQKIMHETIKPLLASISAQLTAVATMLTTAGAQLTATSTAHQVPITGPVAGRVPLQGAAVAITTAGATLASTAPMFISLQAAIQTFEIAEDQYLSKIHIFAEDTGLT